MNRKRLKTMDVQFKSVKDEEEQASSQAFLSKMMFQGLSRNQWLYLETIKNKVQGLWNRFF